MGMLSPATYAMNGSIKVVCLFCGVDRFARRGVKLNTTGMELLGLGWANQTATGLICLNCGFLHTFATDIHMYDQDPTAG